MEAMISYKLKGDYIELVKLLKLLNIASTGGHAKIMVENGDVVRNGEIEHRKRAKIIQGDKLTINNQVVLIE